MNASAEYFNENKYVLLDKALPPNLCKELCDRLHQLVEDEKTSKDPQCPLSDSIYGDEVLDYYLDQFAKPIGENLGMKLIPTYTYARVYRPGEVLAPHTDRPSCEISGTMTLGFDATTVWPIYVGLDPVNNPNGMLEEAPENARRIDLQIGDILMYRGEEIPHWRKEFKGTWQCQVFFHYIDANGPHADKGLKYDGRERLGMNAINAPTEEKTIGRDENAEYLKRRLNGGGADNEHALDIDYERAVAARDGSVIPPKPQSRTAVFPIMGGVMIPSWDMEAPSVATLLPENYPAFTFTPEECQQIIDFHKDIYPDAGTVGGAAGDKTGTVSEIRRVELYNVPLNDETRWVFDKLARATSLVNNEYFNFEIMGITHELQLLHYKTEEKPGHYDWHIDVGHSHSATRKISLSAQLSAPESYNGGELVVNNNGQYLVGAQDQGSITCFPSYFLHKVNPMTSGERWALVIWVHGSNRFR